MSAASETSDRREAILAAAVRVLAREGIGHATTRRIAAEAGINQATLLYHFGSKDELLLEVLRAMMRLTQSVVLATTPVGANPPEALRRSMLAFWEHVEQAPELQVMQYELTLYALRSPASAWLARDQYAGYAAVVEQLLRDTFAAAHAPCATPFAALARFIVGGLDGLILQFISSRDRDTARHDLDTLIAAVVGLAAGHDAALSAAPVAGAIEEAHP